MNSIGNQKCDAVDDADADDDDARVMIPMCHPCCEGDTINCIRVVLKVISPLYDCSKRISHELPLKGLKRY